jgi:hypothetical protein
MSRLTRSLSALLLLTSTLLTGFLLSQPARAQDNGVGLTPPLGWSSWSFVRHNPTAATIEAQADAMKRSGLARVGYKYVNVDDFWYVCPGSQGPDVDAYGRWVTDTTKFPDGIKAVADHVHHDGLRFGLYVTPGISAQAVARNTAIEGTPYHAADIATTATEKNYNCKGMVGIDYTKPGARQFVDSWAAQFASWGVDYVKIDGVGTSDVPDIQAWSAALRGTGRPIHLELSNNLSIGSAATWKQYGNGWRTGGDIECYGCEANGSSFPLTDWSHLSSRFDKAADWQPYGGPGGFNDYDSIEVGNGANDGLTVDERKTQLSLWSLAASPFILGTDLTALDPTDLRLLKNTDVIKVDQDAIDASRLVKTATTQVFAKTERNGDAIVGLFNTGTAPQPVTVTAAQLGLPAAGDYLLDDLWSHRWTESAGTIGAEVAPHGVALYRIRATRHGAALVPPSVVADLTGLTTVTAGVPTTATVSFTDNGVQPVRRVALGLDAPAGWTATPTSSNRFDTVSSGQTVSATFAVTGPPPAEPFVTATVRATVGYRWLGVVPLSSTVDATVATAAPVADPYRTFASTAASFGQAGSRLGIRAAGSDVYGATNQYGAIYRPGAERDGTVATVQVLSQSNTNAWAKAGIIVRNDVTAADTSPGFLILAEAPGHGYVIQWDSNGDGRLDSNSAANNEGVGTATYPCWLRLTRAGAAYTGWYSTDATTWTPVATVTVPSAAPTQDVGVFATSHSSGVTGEVGYDGFTLG